jgi:serine protease AprX
MQSSSTALSANYFSLSGQHGNGRGERRSRRSPGCGAVSPPDQVTARLMKTAHKTFPTTSSAYDPTTGITYVDQYDIFAIGAGYLDLQAALAETTVALGAPPFHPTPFSNPSQAIRTWYLHRGRLGHRRRIFLAVRLGKLCAPEWYNALWGGQTAVWGSPAVNDQQAVSGNQSVWGNQSVMATSILTRGEK